MPTIQWLATLGLALLLPAAHATTAVVFSESTGRYGVAWNEPGKDAALKKALEDCKHRGGKDCKPVKITDEPGFGVVATTCAGNYCGLSVIAGRRSARQAEADAVKDCNSYYGTRDCRAYDNWEERGAAVMQAQAPVASPQKITSPDLRGNQRRTAAAVGGGASSPAGGQSFAATSAAAFAALNDQMAADGTKGLDQRILNDKAVREIAARAVIEGTLESRFNTGKVVAAHALALGVLGEKEIDKARTVVTAVEAKKETAVATKGVRKEAVLDGKHLRIVASAPDFANPGTDSLNHPGVGKGTAYGLTEQFVQFAFPLAERTAAVYTVRMTESEAGKPVQDAKWHAEYLIKKAGLDPAKAVQIGAPKVPFPDAMVVAYRAEGVAFDDPRVGKSVVYVMGVSFPGNKVAYVMSGSVITPVTAFDTDPAKWDKAAGGAMTDFFQNTKIERK